MNNTSPIIEHQLEVLHKFFGPGATPKMKTVVREQVRAVFVERLMKYLYDPHNKVVHRTVRKYFEGFLAMYKYRMTWTQLFNIVSEWKNSVKMFGGAHPDTWNGNTIDSAINNVLKVCDVFYTGSKEIAYASLPDCYKPIFIKCTKQKNKKKKKSRSGTRSSRPTYV